MRGAMVPIRSTGIFVLGLSVILLHGGQIPARPAPRSERRANREKIRLGMTEAEIVGLIGQPAARASNPAADVEEYFYPKSMFWTVAEETFWRGVQSAMSTYDDEEMALLIFRKGRLMSITTVPKRDEMDRRKSSGLEIEQIVQTQTSIAANFARSLSLRSHSITATTASVLAEITSSVQVWMHRDSFSLYSQTANYAAIPYAS
jgi:hypothetical protein